MRDAALAHCDELESRIEASETSKRVALERELCAVDAVLERVRAERSTAADAVASLCDSELVAQHAELTARLDAADALLLALPTAVVEPPSIRIVADEAALLAGAAVFGRVVAPRAITAADLNSRGCSEPCVPRLLSESSSRNSGCTTCHSVRRGDGNIAGCRRHSNALRDNSGG